MVPMHFTSGPPALMLQYETDLKISDRDALRKEVDEIWLVFQADADRGHFTSAVVSAREVPTGLFFKKSSGFNFVFEKAPDGSWHLSGDQKNGRAPK